MDDGLGAMINTHWMNMVIVRFFIFIFIFLGEGRYIYIKKVRGI